MFTTSTTLIDKAYKTTPVITLVVIAIIGLGFFIIQYRKNALESRLAAMQILKLQQETGIAPNSENIQNALHDDYINNLANKVGI